MLTYESLWQQCRIYVPDNECEFCQIEPVPLDYSGITLDIFVFMYILIGCIYSGKKTMF